MPNPVGLRFRIALAPVVYRQLRDLLDMPHLSRLTKLVIVLLLHYGHHPDDESAHGATIALIVHGRHVHRKAIRPLVLSKGLEVARWIPAAGPPWPGAASLPDPCHTPCTPSIEMAMLRAGAGSVAAKQPWSGDPAAWAGVRALESVLGDIGLSPPLRKGHAVLLYQVWISYPDFILRALRSPFELDEARCVRMMHCLGSAVAIMGVVNHYGLEEQLLEAGVGLIKRDLPAVMDAIALHPEWTIFPITARLAYEVDQWLPRGPHAIVRPDTVPGELIRYPLVGLYAQKECSYADEAWHSVLRRRLITSWTRGSRRSETRHFGAHLPGVHNMIFVHEGQGQFLFCIAAGVRHHTISSRQNDMFRRKRRGRHHEDTR